MVTELSRYNLGVAFLRSCPRDTKSNASNSEIPVLNILGR